MSTNKKAPITAATATGARETAVRGIIAAPVHNSTISRGCGQAIDLIPVGRANAITAETIASMTGFSRREVMSQIQAARLHGARICSSPGRPAGYWIAETPAELESNIQELSRRAHQQNDTIACMEQALRSWVNQERMEGW